VLALAGCIHDTGMPLRNDAPEMLSVTPSIEADDTVTLYYPRSAVCTLALSDFNDEVLSVDCKGNWDGHFVQLGRGLDTKRIVPMLTTDSMGSVYVGEWIVSDGAGARVSHPYAVRRIVLDRFALYPPRQDYWELYDWRDTSCCIEPRIDRVWGDTTLQFHFDSTSSRSAPVTTGMYSRYVLGGDFSCTLEYQLATRIGPGFDWHFVVLDRPDTSYLFAELDGEVTYAGFRLSHGGLGYGVYGRGRIEVKDNSRDASAGTLRLERNDGVVSFYHKHKYLDDADTLDYPFDSSFPPESLFVHVRMSVYDFGSPKSCELLRFKVDRGILTATPGRE
jgi:hypothetical protein